jgi:hypothetical protein
LWTYIFIEEHFRASLFNLQAPNDDQPIAVTRQHCR